MIDYYYEECPLPSEADVSRAQETQDKHLLSLEINDAYEGE